MLTLPASAPRLPTSLIIFFLVGVVNTLGTLSTIYLIKWLLSASDGAANACGYLVGITTSFLLNRQWSFRHTGAILPVLIPFLGVFAVAYLANLGTVLGLIHLFGVDGYLAQALGMLPYTTLFYIGARYAVFR